MARAEALRIIIEVFQTQQQTVAYCSSNSDSMPYSIS